MLMDPHPSEPAMPTGPAEYLPMKDLQESQIYTVMNPVDPRLVKHPNLNPQVTILTPTPDPSPPPLPPKRRLPRRSVSLNTPKPHPLVEVEELKMSLRKKEDEVLKMWMDLILARKLALRARHQKKRQKYLIALLIFLLVCLTLLVTLYLVIKQLMPS
uniref:ALTO protein n=1 Tax=Plecotus auritus polyomavirus TaxID=3140010 RepID=A0AAU6S574_9POLY